MFKHISHTTLAGALTALLGLTVSASAIAATQAPASAQRQVPACRTADLTARVGRVDAGAGQRYAQLILTNRSGRTCHTYGFVGLQFLDRWGKPLYTHAIWDRSQRRPARVLVRPRGHAQSLMHWSVIPGIGDSASIGRCEVPTSVEITAPDDTRHLTMRWTNGPVCEGGTVRLLPLTA